MPVPSQAHRLGPHVVGHRVVVRRRLPGETGPSGGPAMTDVLGVCLRWSDGECVVQPESGPAVTIPLDLIVAGKPVPPRPSPARRDSALPGPRVSPRECQLRALALWPDLVTEPLGDWLLRSSPTSTARRANSVLAFGPAGVEDAYERVVAHYARPIANVLPGSAEEALFVERGWVLAGQDAHTVFQLASAARLARALPPGLPAATLEPLGPGLVRVDIDDAASGIAAYADDWVGFRGIEVVATQRGRGLALAVMAALLEWGAAQGATTAYLQVTRDNTPAHRLYEGMGFATHHSYSYLTPAR